LGYKLRTIEAEIPKNLRTASQPQLRIYWFLEKRLLSLKI